MPTKAAIDRAEARRAAIRELLLASPTGLTVTEIASRLDAAYTTSLRTLRDDLYDMRGARVAGSVSNKTGNALATLWSLK